MTVTMIVICAFVGATALALLLGAGLYDRFFRYRDALDERLAESFGAARASHVESAIFRDRRALFDGGLPSRNLTATLVGWLDQSATTLDLKRFAAWTAACATGSAAVAMFAVSSPLLAAAVGASVGLAPTAFVEFHRRSRLAQLRRQLPEAFGAMSRAVRSGHTVQSALRIVADEFEGPIAGEFGRCYGQQDLGMSPETAWRGLASRTDVMELRIFVVGMLVQGRTGGDLVELLDGLADIACKRLRLQMKIKAVTGEGRMQAGVLMALPPAAFIAIFLLAPDYAQTLLDRRWLLALTAGGQIAGAFWIARIIRVDI